MRKKNWEKPIVRKIVAGAAESSTKNGNDSPGQGQNGTGKTGS